MPERQRAYRGQELVTILKGRPGKRGKVEIRNAFGFKETVNGKDLEPVPESESNAVLRYQSND